jgi:hypothetical protein
VIGAYRPDMIARLATKASRSSLVNPRFLWLIGLWWGCQQLFSHNHGRPSHNLSPPRFSVRYRTAFAVSPLEDLLRERLRLAQHPIQHTGLSIAEFAANAGFRDLPRFHRCFRRRFGVTPLQARRR